MNAVKKIDSPGPLSNSLIEECKDILIQRKESIYNRLHSSKAEFQSRDKSGDDIDKSIELLAENQFLATQERLNLQLLEIESALARIENGTYGFCEETEEPIEVDRLRAIPWTRLSIEGAEMREALKKRFAR